MTTHLTLVRTVETGIVAYCPEHHAVDDVRPNTRQGLNVAVISARAHDDTEHNVYRNNLEYRNAANLS